MQWLTERMRDIHWGLIRFVVGQRPIMMNMKVFTPIEFDKMDNAVIYGCTFTGQNIELDYSLINGPTQHPCQLKISEELFNSLPISGQP